MKDSPVCICDVYPEIVVVVENEPIVLNSTIELLFQEICPENDFLSLSIKLFYHTIAVYEPGISLLVDLKARNAI